jgi:hypothetical protein
MFAPDGKARKKIRTERATKLKPDLIYGHSHMGKLNSGERAEPSLNELKMAHESSINLGSIVPVI